MSDAAALPSPIDHAQLRELAATLVTDELVIVPVRHHSPACALQLLRLLAERPPAAVLVEGPRSCTELVPLLAHEGAQAPFAVYTYAVLGGGEQGTRRAAWYPFCDHSPELVAVREGNRLGVPVQFIDLEFAEQCQLEAAHQHVRPTAEHDRGDDAESLLDEHHLVRSQHLRLLAQRLGCRDHEELWEHLFEASASITTPREHIAQVAAYCALARSDHTAAELAADGTLAREAEMAWHVQQALAARPAGAGPVVVVVGGFHAVALPSLLREPAHRPTIDGPRIERSETTLVRYAFDRLDRLNGYAAGMTSPRWQHELWQRLLRHEKAGLRDTRRAREESALQILTDVAEELRDRHRLPLPLPTVAAAYEHVLRLSMLRRRPAPVEADVQDAILGCYVKGDADADGALVQQAARRALTGTAVGRVPKGARLPPLVADFGFRARRQRLKIDDTEPRRVVLDLYRRPEHRRTSRLLHGLLLLEVPFAVRPAGPDFVAGRQLDRLQEHWDYCCTPATEAALVEASVHGTTLPHAVAQRFRDRLDALADGGQAQDARAAAALLTHACVLGLHEQLPRLLVDLRTAIGADADFVTVADAASTLALLHESREPLEARDLDELPVVLQATFERAMFLARDGAMPPKDATPTVQALLQLRELLSSAAGRPLDATLFWQVVEDLHRQAPSPLLQGATAGLLHDQGRLPSDELAVRLDGQLRGTVRVVDAVAYLRGLLTTARQLAWQEPRLLRVLDALLGDWSDAEFVTSLPELRLAFASMTPVETDRIAAALATLHGGQDLGRLVRHDVTAEQLQRNLELSRRVCGRLAIDHLTAWSPP
jgi:hypothetical protein